MASTTPTLPNYGLTAGQSEVFSVNAAGLATLSAEISDVVAEAVEGVASTALNDTCTLLRATKVSDGSGGRQSTWVEVGTLPCNFKSATGYKEPATGGALRSVTTWKAELPLGSDVRPGDRLRKGAYVWDVTDTDAGVTDAEFLTAQLVRILPQAA